MYEYEKTEACEVSGTPAQECVKSFYKELLHFNLVEQNQILKNLYEATKQERLNKLSELKSETEILEVSLKELN